MANNTNKENKEEEFNLAKEIREWVIVIVVAIALAFFIDTVLIVNAVVPSASMETTIMTGDKLFGNRLSYINEDPQRGDIVIFKYPDNEKELFIKRVIGLPGDTLEIKEGKVYINGSSEALNEPYIHEIPWGDYGPITVPEDAYFMLGDNRNNSRDSRFWNQPFVFKNKILGKAVVRYWPNPSKIQ